MNYETQTYFYDVGDMFNQIQKVAESKGLEQACREHIESVIYNLSDDLNQEDTEALIAKHIDSDLDPMIEEFKSLGNDELDMGNDIPKWLLVEL